MWRTLISPSLLALQACAPRYGNLGPIEPLALYAPLEYQTIAIDGVDIAYVDSAFGEDTPIVFLHGLSSYVGFWEYQIPEFAQSHRVLALDLPGFGASARPDAPYTPPWYADLVVRWLDAVGVERAIVVGHSMGGQIAMTLALAHPERVQALVLSAPAGIETFTPGAARTMKAFWTEDRALYATEAEIRANFVAMAFNKVDAGVERLIQERVQLGKHPTFRGTSVAVARSVAGMIDHPVWPRLGEIKAPTLLIYGTDDRMIPNPLFTGGSTRSIAEKGKAAIPGAQLVMLQGAGHTVHHDDAAGFNAAMRSFLLRRDP